MRSPGSLSHRTLVSNVIPGPQQMRGKGVAHGVLRRPLADAGAFCGALERALKGLTEQRVAPDHTASWVGKRHGLCGRRQPAHPAEPNGRGRARCVCCSEDSEPARASGPAAEALAAGTTVGLTCRVTISRATVVLYNTLLAGPSSFSVESNNHNRWWWSGPVGMWASRVSGLSTCPPGGIELMRSKVV